MIELDAEGISLCAYVIRAAGRSEYVKEIGKVNEEGTEAFERAHQHQLHWYDVEKANTSDSLTAEKILATGSHEKYVHELQKSIEDEFRHAVDYVRYKQNC